MKADNPKARLGLLPTAITDMQSVKRLHDWIQAVTARRIQITREEYERLLILIPPARLLLRQMEMDLYLGGAGCAARGDWNWVDDYWRVNEEAFEGHSWPIRP